MDLERVVDSDIAVWSSCCMDLCWDWRVVMVDWRVETLVSVLVMEWRVVVIAVVSVVYFDNSDEAPVDADFDNDSIMR